MHFCNGFNNNKIKLLRDLVSIVKQELFQYEYRNQEKNKANKVVVF